MEFQKSKEYPPLKEFLKSKGYPPAYIYAAFMHESKFRFNPRRETTNHVEVRYYIHF